jgi:MFS family permease
MTTSQSATLPAPRLTLVQWLICTIAAIGFAFDTYELLMIPLIVRPALVDLLGVPACTAAITTGCGPNHPDVVNWVGWIFYLPAIPGGIFGLLGGYLTDRFGRRRVLTWSILLYAISAFMTGLSTSVWTFLFWRCCTFIGVCVEFVAAVAWLSELFPHPKQREAVVGYTLAFASFGGLMVTAANYLVVTYGASLPEVYGGHEAWRYTLMSGVIPAFPLIVIRPFLPESPTWRSKKAAGTLKRPSLGELFQVEYRRTTVVATIMMACAYGAAFGAVQQVPGIVPGLAEVRELPRTTPQERAAAAVTQQQSVAEVQGYQEIGGLVGRMLLAFLAIRILSRQRVLRIFQVPGLFVIPLVFFFSTSLSLETLKWGAALAGVLTVGQFSFWGNYLPRVYPTYLRGTGESFAANVGGRMLGTSAALITTRLAGVMPGTTGPTRLAVACAVVGGLVYLGGLVASFWLPEPKKEALPE